ncbi:hypothetical protein Sta7437_4565 (plasmid) [Stanieria cyanosphaera PCC 7437]|uniref:Uncharacterized protein n=1 Tax=Stanieria cyanosphaera (strain ATCC 29371 / PCC 7437) TaxID=111780 RepID=K9Y128_STAC7|nr:hypothetical protein [Stanieria cyanosphaera]AFZ38024.1 hypothetical protein Sta7437_4565 [Stanieria cyanosphaera PCC 7437]
MLQANRKPGLFSLRLGQTWKSFEKFRTEGAKALSTIKDGAVATLTTKTGQYRIIEERDFQQMYGLARDVDRLRGGLRMVTVAVKAAQKHPDRENLEVLAEAVAMLGELPELPTRDSFESLMPENTDFDDDDDVMLDSNQIERPFSNATPILEDKFD